MDFLLSLAVRIHYCKVSMAFTITSSLMQFKQLIVCSRTFCKLYCRLLDSFLPASSSALLPIVCICVRVSVRSFRGFYPLFLICFVLFGKKSCTSYHTMVLFRSLIVSFICSLCLASYWQLKNSYNFFLIFTHFFQQLHFRFSF